MELSLYVDSARTTRYKPIDKQIEFHQSAAKFRCFSGGVGSGKTTAGAVEALKAMLQFPGSRGLIGRFTDGELRKTSWREFRTIVPEELIAYENQADLLVRLKNGSEAMGMHLQEEVKIRSLTLDWAWVDEATEVPERLFMQIMGRLRNRVGPRRAWVTTNPESRSSWVYRYFYENAKPGFQWFHARTADAVFLPPDYLNSLYETWDTEWAQRFLEGTWDSFEGMVFPMFTRECHVIPWAAADIPAEWPRYRALDHGWSDPATCVFGAVAPDGTVFIYDIFYRKHRTVEQICEEVLAMSEGQTFEWTVLDPRSASQHVSTTGRRISEHYAACGLPVAVPKRTDIMPGLAKMRQMLEVRTGVKHPTLMTAEGRHVYRGARLYICAHCVPLIKELFNYRYPEEGGEVPLDKDNHAIDALRYMVTHNPRAPESVETGDWQQWFTRLHQDFPRRPDFPFGEVIGNERAVVYH
jgi:phage terminase large subunit